MPIPTALPELTDYQKQMLASIQPMINAYRSRKGVLSSSQRRGKSAYTNTVTSQARGKEITQIWVDEYDYVVADELKSVLSPKVRPDLEEVIDDPKWPGSRIEIWRKETDRRDPRNPNPKAGRIIKYEIRGEFCIREEIQGLMFAKQRAQHLHEIAVKKVQDMMRAANPLFGRF
ncbi:hypothetical protein EV128_125104 [Rhizobium azibense]|nr:hypothetical protein EV128_125104 [Rhizobium azibense]